MTPEYRQQRIREATANLQRIQKAMGALGQRMKTSVDVLRAHDWEDRYLAEGTVDLERFANGEPPREEWRP